MNTDPKGEFPVVIVVALVESFVVGGIIVAGKLILDAVDDEMQILTSRMARRCRLGLLRLPRRSSPDKHGGLSDEGKRALWNTPFNPSFVPG